MSRSRGSRLLRLFARTSSVPFPESAIERSDGPTKTPSSPSIARISSSSASAAAVSIIAKATSRRASRGRSRCAARSRAAAPRGSGRRSAGRAADISPPRRSARASSAVSIIGMMTPGRAEVEDTAKPAPGLDRQATSDGLAEQRGALDAELQAALVEEPMLDVEGDRVEIGPQERLVRRAARAAESRRTARSRLRPSRTLQCGKGQGRLTRCGSGSRLRRGTGPCAAGSGGRNDRRRPRRNPPGSSGRRRRRRAQEVRLDDLLRIGLGVVAALAQLLGRPEADQLVAPGLDAEPQFLVMGVAGLEIPLAIVQGHPGSPFSSRQPRTCGLADAIRAKRPLLKHDLAMRALDALDLAHGRTTSRRSARADC